MGKIKRFSGIFFFFLIKLRENLQVSQTPTAQLLRKTINYSAIHKPKQKENVLLLNER